MKNSDHLSVLVTDASRGSAISIIRSLGRKGIHVIAADTTCQCLGFHSRYTRETFVYPPPEIAPFDFVDSLAYAARHKQIDLIIPVTDAAILPLSEGRKKFEGICQLCIPEPAALELVTNKKKTLDLASRLGVPIPKTCVAYSLEEALAGSNQMGWPLVLKPIVSRKLHEKKSIESYSVSYANDLEQLSGQMGFFEGRCPVLLQEYYPGIGCGVELLLFQGLPRAVFQHKRIREIPINGGASSFRESVVINPDLYDYAVRMMQALCWTGLAMVEFKIGKDGPKLMEINGRVWGSLPLAVLSGMDFPALLADLYFSDPLEDPSNLLRDYKVGVRARNLELDILWILTVLKGKKRYPFLPMPGRGEAVKALIALMNPGYRFDILSLDDPLPGLFEIRKIIQKVGKKIQENG
jgi:predicted ATP-grasp superfamily ATP-dependent carboligase